MSSDNHGSERTYQPYWCYQCGRTVRISAPDTPSDVACPRCFGQFVREIGRNADSGPRLLLDYPGADLDASPGARLLESLSLMLRDEPARPRHHRRHRGARGHSFDDGAAAEVPLEPQSRMWIVLHPIDPSSPFAPLFHRTVLLPEEDGRRRDPRDYFLGGAGGLDELIEELTQNDRPGPAPAGEADIAAIPTVRISESHSEVCPVCKDEFEVGGEARELPCGHVYHSDCIVPWMRLHNSCPVCRKGIPVPASADGRAARRWGRLGFLWPFRSRNGRQVVPHGHGGDSYNPPRPGGIPWERGLYPHVWINSGCSWLCK